MIPGFQYCLQTDMVYPLCPVKNAFVYFFLIFNIFMSMRCPRFGLVFCCDNSDELLWLNEMKRQSFVYYLESVRKIIISDDKIVLDGSSFSPPATLEGREGGGASKSLGRRFQPHVSFDCHMQRQIVPLKSQRRTSCKETNASHAGLTSPHCLMGCTLQRPSSAMNLTWV